MLPFVYHLTGVNPHPWVAPNSSTGRRDGKIYTKHFTSESLKTFQNAVREELPLQNGHVELLPKDMSLKVTFYVCRELDVPEDHKRHAAHWADSTNCQKALEDALQGIIYHNDKLNRDVRFVMVEQSNTTEGHIIIVVEEFDPAALAKELLKYPRPHYEQQTTSNVRHVPDQLF